MSGALPIGTVTFLFTDVEGSTRLLEELGAADYAVELGRHREIVRRALAENGGVEVDTQGDAFFCAFGSARAAVACAAGIQDALAAGPVRVRMGVHTGEALLVDRHYVGMDVHRAARIGACGHGGQVVLSPSTVGVLEPGEFVLRDLGAHRLKDLAAPVVLHQLGEETFPPLKALFRTNLPVPATPFIGREVELVELVERASEQGVRVLTLTGPGGTGKTRLSLQLVAELADSYEDGVWWLPLASLRDGALVASAIASVLDVDEEPERALAETIAGALARKKVLLLLDNCEHVLAAVSELVSAVVGASPDVLVVATSREPLAITGEQVFSVQPLVERDAVELFHARARASGAKVDAADPVVGELCARLDNLPLAVELAAARAAVLPPAALLQRLATRLDVLAGPRDVDERQRTLRAAIAWSYDLLEDVERRLFRRLAVFVGGASLSAIEFVCEADLEDILSVASKSLVRQASEDGGEPRYFMLETIREFAAEELAASGELGALQERHGELFAGLARAAREGVEEADSGEWLPRLERDLANLRAAFSFAAVGDRRDDAARLAFALSMSHFSRGRYSEAEEVVRRALVLDPEPIAQAGLQETLGVVLRLQGNPRAALESYEAAERTLEGIADRSKTWWRCWLDLQIAKATLFYFENEQAALVALVGELEPLVHEHGTPMQELDLLHLRGQQAYRRERYALSEETEALVRETYRMAVELGEASADFTLGFCLLWRGKPLEAEEYLARGREVARARGVALIETRCLVYGVVARRLRHDVDGARACLQVLLEQDELHGYRGLTSANAAWIAYRDGDHDLAIRRAEEALADWHSAGRLGSSVFQWTALFPLLAVAVARGDLDGAADHAQAMLDESQQPLPEEVARALEAGADDSYAHALELAHAAGYV